MDGRAEEQDGKEKTGWIGKDQRRASGASSFSEMRGISATEHRGRSEYAGIEGRALLPMRRYQPNSREAPSLSSVNRTQIDQLSKQIADLRKADAREAKKEADLLGKVNRAQSAVNRTKSASLVQSKRKEMERASSELATVQKKRADISGKMAQKAKTLRSYEERQAKDDERARKKAAEEQKRLIRERQMLEARLQTELLAPAQLAGTGAVLQIDDEHYDFFISHASEDKDGFVRELAEALRNRGAKVWYDEFTLKVGYSLRRGIDRGLGRSTFGVVVLSQHFFEKEWANKELDGLVAREVAGETRILPIWHKVSKDEVRRYSATLADKVALSTSTKTVEEIADELCSLLD